MGNDPLNLTDPSGRLSVGGVINFTFGAGELAIGVGFATVTSWTGTNAAALGRTALFAPSAFGYGLEGGAAIQGGVIGQAQAAKANRSQGAGK